MSRFMDWLLNIKRAEKEDDLTYFVYAYHTTCKKLDIALESLEYIAQFGDDEAICALRDIKALDES
jgi:hypothetical protein